MVYENNPGKYREMLLEQLQNTIESGLDALDTLDVETPGVDLRSDHISNLKDKLNSLHEKVSYTE